MFAASHIDQLDKMSAIVVFVSRHFLEKSVELFGTTSCISIKLLSQNFASSRNNLCLEQLIAGDHFSLGQLLIQWKGGMDF